MNDLKSVLNWKQPLLFDRNNPLCIWLNVFNVTLMSMLVIIDLLSSVVVTSEIQGYLSVDDTKTVWIGKGFFFGAALMSLCSNFLARKYGYKLMLVIGNIVFSVGAIGTGFATEYYEMVFFRVIGGIGGGIIMSISLTIITYTVPKKDLNIAIIVYNNLFFGFGIGMGLILGGYIGQTMLWRHLFYMNLFLSLPTILLTWILIPETEKRQNQKFDFIGFISLGIFFITLLTIVTQAKAPWNTLGWNSSFIHTCFIVAFVSFLVFLFNLFENPKPIIHLGLFTHPRFWVGLIGLGIVGFMVFGPSIVLINILEQFYHYERVVLGLFISLVGFIYLIFGAFTTILSSFIHPRIFTITGLLLIAASCFLSQDITIQSTREEMGQLLVLRSIGIAIVLGPLTVLALAPFEGEEETHHAVSVLTFARQMAATFGSAVIDLIIAERTPYHSLRFGEQVNIYSPGFQKYIHKLDIHSTNFHSSGFPKGLKQARELVISWINDQAVIASFNDALFILGWAVTALLGIIICIIILHITVFKDNFPEKRENRA